MNQYEPKTSFHEFGKIRVRCWDCECGLFHSLHEEGRYVITCPCGQQAGFIVDNEYKAGGIQT